MKIYVINRQENQSRRKYIEQHFEAIKAPVYEFFQATEGTQLSATLVEKCNTWHTRCFLRRAITRGEIGCTLSHLSIYKEIISKDLAGALIFEDDVQILENKLFGLVEHWVDLLDQSASILHLGSCHRDRNNIPIKHIKRVGGTHAYYINKLAAGNMLRAFNDLPKIPIDKFSLLIRAKVCNVYLFNKRLATQGALGSTIALRKRNRSFRLLKGIIRLYLMFIYCPVRYRLGKSLFA